MWQPVRLKAMVQGSRCQAHPSPRADVELWCDRQTSCIGCRNWHRRALGRQEIQAATSWYSNSRALGSPRPARMRAAQHTGIESVSGPLARSADGRGGRRRLRALRTTRLSARRRSSTWRSPTCSSCGPTPRAPVPSRRRSAGPLVCYGQLNKKKSG